MMQQIGVSAEEVFTAYKNQVGELGHELLLLQLQVKKMQEVIEGYERAEADRVRTAAMQRAVAQPSQPEAMPAPNTPAPPLPVLPAAPEAPGDKQSG